MFRRTAGRLGHALTVGWILAVRDFKAQYGGSLAGYGWLILTPGLYASLFLVIRYQMEKQGIVIDTNGVPPLLFAFFGILLWQNWFDTLLKQTDVFRTARPIMRSYPLPISIFFLSTFIQSMLDCCVRIVLIVLAMLALGVSPGPYWFLAPVFALLTTMTANVLGLILALPASFYSDVRKALQASSLGILLATPILYPLPASTDSLLFKINMFNPLAATLVTARDYAFGDLAPLASFGVLWSLVLMGLGLFFLLAYQAASPIVVERLR
jgi:lipopolysaccharide transport system permease protein